MLYGEPGVNSGQVEPMPGVSHDTAFEVALSNLFILYHILEHACIAAEPLRGHIVDVWACRGE